MTWSSQATRTVFSPSKSSKRFKIYKNDCFRKSIAKLNDVELDYAWLQMDKQKASSGVLYNFMKDNYGNGKINVFMNGEAAYTTELALNKVENDEIIAKYVSGN